MAPWLTVKRLVALSSLTGDYCPAIQIVTTDNNNVQTTYNLSPTSAHYVWLQQLTNIVSVVITFSSTNNPYRRVHLTEVMFGTQFLWTGNNLFDLDNNLVSDDYLAAQGFRKTMVDNYIIFYTVSEKDKTVAVVRILYGRRDWIHLHDGA